MKLQNYRSVFLPSGDFTCDSKAFWSTSSCRCAEATTDVIMRSDSDCAGNPKNPNADSNPLDVFF